jgi:hypothetical protein
MVIDFPKLHRSARRHDLADGHLASVVILPVIRIQRHTEDPGDSVEHRSRAAGARRRRKRAARS